MSRKPSLFLEWRPQSESGRGLSREPGRTARFRGASVLTRFRGQGGENRAAPTGRPATRPTRHTRQPARGRTGKGNAAGAGSPQGTVSGGGGRSVQHPARAGVGQGAPGVKPSPGSDGDSGARRAPRPNPASGSARLCVESSIQFSRIPGNLPPSSVIYSHEMPQFPDCRKHLTGKSNSCCKFMFGSRGETIPEKKPNKSVRPEP